MFCSYKYNNGKKRKLIYTTNQEWGRSNIWDHHIKQKEKLIIEHGI